MKLILDKVDFRARSVTIEQGYSIQHYWNFGLDNTLLVVRGGGRTVLCTVGHLPASLVPTQ